jgi:hypothetical protein
MESRRALPPQGLDCSGFEECNPLYGRGKQNTLPMAQRVAIGLVVGVIAVLVLSLLGPLGPSGASVAAPTPVHDSILPAAAPPSPFSMGMAASVALGAYNLTSFNRPGTVNASTFQGDPELSTLDSHGDVWVPDFGGSRVLEFTPPFTTGENASIVIGQSNFTSNLHNRTSTSFNDVAAAVFNAQGDLFVADYENNRIMEFEPPFSTGMAASVVIGQSSFTGYQPGASATNLSNPAGVSIDAHGDLWVADKLNSRVVEFVPPFVTGMAASLVIGQSNFTGDQTGLTATNLSTPLDVDASGNILWVADYGNDRVVGYPMPWVTGEAATYLLGQSTFTSTGASGPGAFVSALAVSVDPRGNVWVSDPNGNRVVEFVPPFTTFENATLALGQDSLSGTSGGDNATTLSFPLGIVFAPDGAAWVTDGQNNRVLEYIPSQFDVTFDAVGLPSTFHWSVVLDGASVAATSPNVTVAKENGSYAWSIPAIPGYTFSPASGTVSVNGTNPRVLVTATEVVYSVTFSATGLPAATGWSVTLGGVTQSSPNNGSITFSQPGPRWLAAPTPRSA